MSGDFEEYQPGQVFARMPEGVYPVMDHRSYFAIMALQSLITAFPQSEESKLAECAVVQADALIAELNKPAMPPVKGTNE